MAKEAAFVHVERSNLLHVVVTHLKVEHVKVLIGRGYSYLRQMVPTLQVAPYFPLSTQPR